MIRAICALALVVFFAALTVCVPVIVLAGIGRF